MSNHGAGAEDRDDSAIVIPLNEVRREKDDLPVTFHRRELDRILRIYSEMVGAGEWRDYAIDHLSGLAMFSVFRHAADRPLYGIAKIAGARSWDYVLFEGDRRLKRSRSLAEVIAHLRREMRPGD